MQVGVSVQKIPFFKRPFVTASYYFVVPSFYPFCNEWFFTFYPTPTPPRPAGTSILQNLSNALHLALLPPQNQRNRQPGPDIRVVLALGERVVVTEAIRKMCISYRPHVPESLMLIA